MPKQLLPSHPVGLLLAAVAVGLSLGCTRSVGAAVLLGLVVLNVSTALIVAFSI